MEGLLYKPHNNLSPLISLLGQSNVAARYNSAERNYVNCPVYQTLNEKNPGTPVYQLPVYQSNGQPTNFSNEIQLETPKARTSPIAQEDQPTYQGLVNENSEFVYDNCIVCIVSLIFYQFALSRKHSNMNNKIMSHKFIYHEYMK